MRCRASGSAGRGARGTGSARTRHFVVVLVSRSRGCTVARASPIPATKKNEEAVVCQSVSCQLSVVSLSVCARSGVWSQESVSQLSVTGRAGAQAARARRSPASGVWSPQARVRSPASGVRCPAVLPAPMVPGTAYCALFVECDSRPCFCCLASWLVGRFLFLFFLGGSWARSLMLYVFVFASWRWRVVDGG